MYIQKDKQTNKSVNFMQLKTIFLIMFATSTLDNDKVLHSGIYGHKNEIQILEIVAFIVQFCTYFNTYDMN